MINNFPKNKVYDYIFSIGEACSCASSLKINYLRNCAGPFDWCYGADLIKRSELIVDEFMFFFRQDDFVELDIPNMTHHVMKNSYTGIVYNHDFPKDKDFSKIFESVRQKYERRIRRFMNALKSKKVLLVYLALPDVEKDVLGLKREEDILMVAKNLHAKYPNVDLLYIRHNENLQDKQAIFKQLSPECTIVDVFNYVRGHIISGNNCNHDNVSHAMSYIKLKPFDYIRNLLRYKKFGFARKLLRLFYHKNDKKKYTRVLCFRFKTE